ncbi:MAG TPA: ribose 5-phosphate isomerase B [Candidatus Binatia bacterium]|nr:ribose 5-phosphate isomerase B [Candidatus Binatia bacterium]
MRIIIGADHAGYPLKTTLAADLRARGHEVTDVGTAGEDPVDYPDFAEKVAKLLLDGRGDRGILLCGSGVGASVAANKIPGIRAGLCHDCYSAHQAVEHDDINMLVLGARVIGAELAREVVERFLSAKFTGEERHRRRIDKIRALERRYSKTA